MHVLTREFTGRLSITQPTTSNIVFSAVLMAAHTNKFIALQGPSEFTQCSQRFVTGSNRATGCSLSLDAQPGTPGPRQAVVEGLSWVHLGEPLHYGEGGYDSDKNAGPDCGAGSATAMMSCRVSFPAARATFRAETIASRLPRPSRWVTRA